MTIEFLITSLLVVIIPGTGMIYTLACSLSRGWTGSFFGALGSTLSIIPHILAAVFGLAAILHTSAVAFQLVKFAGVAYLLYMAWGIVRDNSTLNIKGAKDNRSNFLVMFHGILASLLNPKLSVFFMAFLPQFISAQSLNPVSQMFALGFVFMSMTFAVFFVVGLAAVTVRDKIISRPNILRWLKTHFCGFICHACCKTEFNRTLRNSAFGNLVNFVC